MVICAVNNGECEYHSVLLRIERDYSYNNDAQYSQCASHICQYTHTDACWECYIVEAGRCILPGLLRNVKAYGDHQATRG